MKVDPNGRVLKLNDPDLRNYPFRFMEHPGYMMLRDDEVAGLRKYLLAGGVFTPDLIETWLTFKRIKEIDEVRLRPHPWEFYLYYDI